MKFLWLSQNSRQELKTKTKHNRGNKVEHSSQKYMSQFSALNEIHLKLLLQEHKQNLLWFFIPKKCLESTCFITVFHATKANYSSLQRALISWYNFFIRMWKTLKLMCNGKSHQKYSMFETKFNIKIFNIFLLSQTTNIAKFHISRSTTLINPTFCVGISNIKNTRTSYKLLLITSYKKLLLGKVKLQAILVLYFQFPATLYFSRDGKRFESVAFEIQCSDMENCKHFVVLGIDRNCL